MTASSPGPAVLEELRSRLEDQQLQLLDGVRQRLLESEQARERISERELQGMEDSATLAAMAEVSLADASRDIEQIRDIDTALIRMRHGIYGICCDCGESVPEERLRAYPTAKRCRDCQEIKEFRQRTQSG